jgi:hypothetical protein
MSSGQALPLDGDPRAAALRRVVRVAMPLLRTGQSATFALPAARCNLRQRDLEAARDDLRLAIESVCGLPVRLHASGFVLERGEEEGW